MEPGQGRFMAGPGKDQGLDQELDKKFVVGGVVLIIVSTPGPVLTRLG